MANYYYITIKSDKMTQEVANQIFQEMATKNKIRSFNFHEGYLTYNTRGLTDITNILESVGFTDEEVEVKSEFDLAYEDLPEETKQALNTIKNEINKAKDLLKGVNLTTPYLPKMDNEKWWIGLI